MILQVVSPWANCNGASVVMRLRRVSPVNFSYTEYCKKVDGKFYLLDFWNEWQVVAVNATFIKRVDNGVRAKKNVIYKYTGIIKCGECGRNLVTISSVRKNGRKKYYASLLIISTAKRIAQGITLVMMTLTV